MMTYISLYASFISSYNMRFYRIPKIFLDLSSE
jgi:hypothetical protein